MRRRFPRQVQALAEIFDFAARFCAAEEIDDRDRWVVDLTLEELFTNVLKHNPEGEGELLIELERTDGAMRIALTDFDSDRFDPTALAPPDTNAPLEQRKPGGLGIHLIEQLTDEIRYEYRGRAGTTTVTKKLG